MHDTRKQTQQKKILEKKCWLSAGLNFRPYTLAKETTEVHKIC